MMHSVTKAMPIKFINSKCHIKKWKSCKTALSGKREGTHTYTPTFVDKEQFQEARHARALFTKLKIKTS